MGESVLKKQLLSVVSNPQMGILQANQREMTNTSMKERNVFIVSAGLKKPLLQENMHEQSKQKKRPGWMGASSGLIESVTQKEVIESR